MANNALILIVILIPFLFLVSNAAAECTCDALDLESDPKSVTMPYKVGSIFAILVASSLGVAVPLAGKRFPAMSPDGDAFLVVKAFAAGVILATGFIHIIPDAFESLSSPCLSSAAWSDFPFAGFVAMVAAVATLMVESSAAGYYRRVHFAGKAVAGGSDEEGSAAGEHAGHVHMHTHAAGHGHAHGDVVVAREESSKLDLIRHRVTTQVLELGIVVHSVIIGISLGTSQTLATIKPLLAALCFHQFFEGLGLGGCIAQAKFKWQTITTMAMFFSLTTPVGVAIGIGVANSYNENSETSLIVQGVFDSAAGGILIYMALVGLLATDFMSPRVQNSPRLHQAATVSLLLGVGFMSLLAKWA